MTAPGFDSDRHAYLAGRIFAVLYEELGRDVVRLVTGLDGSLTPLIAVRLPDGRGERPVTMEQSTDVEVVLHVLPPP